MSSNHRSKNPTTAKTKSSAVKMPNQQGTPTSKAGTGSKEKSLWDRLEAELPEWCLKIKDNRQQKLLIRCWLASRITVLLILPNKNLAIMGNAAFFAGIASLLMPVNMPIQSFLMAAIFLVSGCCLGWAWGCAAMAAAYRARDKALYQRTVQDLASSYGLGFSTGVVQVRIFHGDFLDTRSTVVFGVFLAIGSFVLAYTRVSNPKLALPTIFSTIFLDVLCSYGPLFPTPQYTILKTFVISTAYYIAIGLVLIVVVFPQSLNHEWLRGANKLLTGIQELLELQAETFQAEPSDLITEESTLLTRLRGKGEGLTKSFKDLSAKTSMLSLEFSYGQLSATDLQSLELPIRNLITRSRGLIAFTSLLVSHAKTRGKDHGPRAEGHPGKDETVTPRKLCVGDTFRLMHVREVDSKWEDEHNLRIEELLPILEAATSNLRAATVTGVKAANNALEVINTQRYKRKLPWEKKVREEINAEEADVAKALTALNTALQEYQSTSRLALLEPYADLMASPFEVDQHGRPPFSLRPLFLCFVFQSNLVWTAEAMKSLLALLNEAQKKRPEEQLWFSAGLSKIFDYFKSDGGPSALDADLPPPIPDKPGKGEEDYFKSDHQKDPDSLPPENLTQKLGNQVHLFHHWLTTREVVFALKFMVISILLWLPQVFKRSAWFTYSERGLWGLIMGQLTLALYMSDQLAALKSRVIGTVAGGALGCVAWYVGNGHGIGNPYGTAASAAVFLLPIVFLRLYYPTPMEAIMMGVTTILVIGYSWIDTHLNQLGNIGAGWSVAWRRVLLVLIGSGAALIFMILPPQSLRSDVRRTNSATIRDIARLYSGLVSTWLSETQDVADSDSPSPSTSSSSSSSEDEDNHKKSVASYAKWVPAFREKLIDVAGRLQTLRLQTAASKWEGSFRGKWPFDKYDRLVTIQTTMVNNLVQLSGALHDLDPKWRKTLMHNTAFLNLNLLTDVMAVFAIVAMSLDTGEAIHEVLPKSLLDRVFYHYSMGPHISQSVPVSPDDEDGDDDQTIHKAPLMLKNRYGSMQFAVYATGCAAAYQLLLALDDLHRTVKELCGEVPLKGFERWRKEFEMKQLEERV